jgi:hypothetical protein
MGFFERMGLVTPKEENDIKPSKTAPVVQAPVIQTNFSTVINTEDAQIYAKIFEDALAERNEPGPDFYEFYKTLQGVENQAIPEQQKYIMAFTGLSTMGLTKEKAISTSNSYITEIEKQHKEFLQTMKTWETIEITDKQKASQKLAEDNIRLQQTIQENMNKISELNIAVASNTQKLATKTQQFNAIYEIQKNRVIDIVNKIKTYL